MRRRTLTFQQIVDSRFGQNLNMLNKRIKKIHHDLGILQGIEMVRSAKPYKLTFNGREPSIQWRVNFYVNKNQQVTWDKVMETINNINAPFYKFI